MKREELEDSVTTESEREILGILDKICPTAFITNRNRKELITKISELLEKKEDSDYWLYI